MDQVPILTLLTLAFVYTRYRGRWRRRQPYQPPTDPLYKVVRREGPQRPPLLFWNGRGWQLRQRFVSESAFAQEWFVFITEDSSTLFATRTEQAEWRRVDGIRF